MYAPASENCTIRYSRCSAMMQMKIFQNIPRIANTEPEYDRLQKLPKIKNGSSGITNFASTRFIISLNSLIAL